MRVDTSSAARVVVRAMREMGACDRDVAVEALHTDDTRDPVSDVFAGALIVAGSEGLDTSQAPEASLRDSRDRSPAGTPWSASSAFIDLVDGNRRCWLSRRCRSDYWGMFTHHGKPAPEGRHAKVTCAVCGQAYTVNPHQGGSFLRRHCVAKHPEAWTWWTDRVRESEARRERDGFGILENERERGSLEEASLDLDANGTREKRKRKRKRDDVDDERAHFRVNPGFDSARFGADGVALLASECAPCELRPKRFFVAWSGVLTIAWRGFPPAIKALKREAQAAFRAALPPENPGSRWAKTTLGCLRDDKRLTVEGLRRLARVCDERTRAFLRDEPEDCDSLRGEEEDRREDVANRISRNEPSTASREERVVSSDVSDAPRARRSFRVAVDSASVVVYQCRSLERVLSEHVVRFAPRRSEATSTGTRLEGVEGDATDPEAPDSEETAIVDSVLAQFPGPEHAESYFFDAGRDGNRERHYRGVETGVTLAIRVAGEGFARAVDAFRRAVDEILPGYYAWFEDRSLHCTIRSLVE